MVCDDCEQSSAELKSDIKAIKDDLTEVKTDVKNILSFLRGVFCTDGVYPGSVSAAHLISSTDNNAARNLRSSGSNPGAKVVDQGEVGSYLDAIVAPRSSAPTLRSSRNRLHEMNFDDADYTEYLNKPNKAYVNQYQRRSIKRETPDEYNNEQDDDNELLDLAEELRNKDTKPFPRELTATIAQHDDVKNILLIRKPNGEIVNAMEVVGYQRRAPTSYGIALAQRVWGLFSMNKANFGFEQFSGKRNGRRQVPRSQLEIMDKALFMKFHDYFERYFDDTPKLADELGRVYVAIDQAMRDEKRRLIQKRNSRLMNGGGLDGIGKKMRFSFKPRADCCVPGCSNNTMNSPDDVCFYRFPIAADLRRKWILNINGDTSWKPDLFDRVCSDHFEEYYFEINLKTRERTKLARDAVPTLFHDSDQQDAEDEYYESSTAVRASNYYLNDSDEEAAAAAGLSADEEENEEQYEEDTGELEEQD